MSCVEWNIGLVLNGFIPSLATLRNSRWLGWLMSLNDRSELSYYSHCLLNSCLLNTIACSRREHPQIVNRWRVTWAHFVRQNYLQCSWSEAENTFLLILSLIVIQSNCNLLIKGNGARMQRGNRASIKSDIKLGTFCRMFDWNLEILEITIAKLLKIDDEEMLQAIDLFAKLRGLFYRLSASSMH